MVCISKEISNELLPFLRVYKDGSVERLIGSPFVPPSQDSSTNVSSKDITISKDLSARIYLPKPSTPTQKFPILAYFHGGGFCIESAFSFLSHQYLNALACIAKVLIISVDYRLAPEHPLPTAYEDSWTALQWIASQSMFKNETWLEKHGNFDQLFVGGDSSGANIAHNLTMKASQEDQKSLFGIKIQGSLLLHPYFLGSQPVGSEPTTTDHSNTLLYKTWDFVYPNAGGGYDNPLINPFANDAPSLTWLGCSRILVCVAEKDELRERGVRYYEAVKKSGWKGKVELFEIEGENHCFHIFNLDCDKAKLMLKRIAAFFFAVSSLNKNSYE